MLGQPGGAHRPDALDAVGGGGEAEGVGEVVDDPAAAPYISLAVGCPGLTSESMRSNSGRWHSARLQTSAGQ